ncbi:hypothetical protein MJO28_014258 [Puccinia striiformis f. sp. tritici]|uniref:Ig-like domain-containing protein n=3 Tax=Puccinia striiformis TaxID=27350 RepID=A0A0L0W3Z3_9BASI|nr:hypothetical protein Pst134EB_027285 [Puccinia striiformis f. sp. tritici]KAI7933812.1 hypothetical protein MJO28_017464 [Puccinia striiformis f. sp. tritici]KAI7938679.1 hypothetical protein MJO28_014258 [Puccinia striiformis f. sp. tritici]KNF06197.1 hypothetical protein PSTG_00705 [Puccinia striiformis f. sp. tritici PST-78]POW05472.1 hypothetical protein PSTT_09671 [Puccinia striiformis]
MVTLSSRLRPGLLLSFSFLVGRIMGDSNPGGSGSVPTGSDDLDMLVCSGEKPVGYLVMSGNSKHKMYTASGDNYSALTGNCTCAPLFGGVQILSCNLRPKLNLTPSKVLPFCWRGDGSSAQGATTTGCPRFRKTMGDVVGDDSIQAQLCDGQNPVGLLYDDQTVLPNSGKAEDAVYGCRCTVPNKQQISYLKCQDASPRFAGVKDPSKVSCVNPQFTCA